MEEIAGDLPVINVSTIPTLRCQTLQGTDKASRVIQQMLSETADSSSLSPLLGTVIKNPQHERLPFLRPPVCIMTDALHLRMGLLEAVHRKRPGGHELWLIGVLSSGCSVALHMKSFQPFFYTQILPSDTNMDDLCTSINRSLKYDAVVESKFSLQHRRLAPIAKVSEEERIPLIGFTNRRHDKLAKITLNNYSYLHEVLKVLKDQGRQVYHENWTLDEQFFYTNNGIRMNKWFDVPKHQIQWTSTNRQTTVQMEGSVADWRSLQPVMDTGLPELPLLCCAYDIETVNLTAHREGKKLYPRATAKDNPVVCVASVFYTHFQPTTLLKVLHVLVPKGQTCEPIEGVIVYIFEHERDLLTSLRNMWSINDVDVLTGYNTLMYDFPYLLSRATVVAASQFSAITRFVEEKVIGVNDRGFAYITGRTQLDLLPILRAQERLPNYKLKTVCQTLLPSGVTKVDLPYEHLATYHLGTAVKRADLAFYCLVDTLLCVMLDRERLLLASYLELSWLTHTSMNQLVTRGETIRVYHCICEEVQRKGWYINRESLQQEPYSEPVPENWDGGASTNEPLLSALSEARQQHRLEPDDGWDETAENETAIRQRNKWEEMRLETFRNLTDIDNGLKTNIINKGVKRHCIDNMFEDQRKLKRKKGIEIPKPGHDKSDGGCVLRPLSALWSGFVSVLDFKSLYPSIIQSENVDYSLLVLNSALLDNTLANMDNGRKLRRFAIKGRFYYLAVPLEGESSVMPTILNRLVEQRATCKRLMQQANDTRKKVLDKQQQALKIVCNSAYGYLKANKAKDALSVPILAAIVTSIGRNMLRYTKQVAETQGALVLYGDTDSCFVTLADTKSRVCRVDHDAACKRIVSIVNNFLPSPQELQLEATTKSFLLLLKKTYAFWDVDHNKIVSKGMAAVRRNFPSFVRNTCSRITEMILQGYADEAIALVSEKVKALQQGKVSMWDLGASAKYDEKNKNKDTIHARVFQRIEKRTGCQFANGDRVEFVVLKSNGKCHIGDRVEEVAHANATGLIVDTDYYLKQLRKPVCTLLQFHLDAKVYFDRLVQKNSILSFGFHEDYKNTEGENKEKNESTVQQLEQQQQEPQHAEVAWEVIDECNSDEEDIIESESEKEQEDDNV